MGPITRYTGAHNESFRWKVVRMALDALNIHIELDCRLAFISKNTASNSLVTSENLTDAICFRRDETMSSGEQNEVT